MREFSKWKASPAKVLLAVLLTAAVLFTVVTPSVLSNNVAYAEGWYEGADNVTYSYERGFTATPGRITSVVFGENTYTDIPASLGIIEPNEDGRKFGGFELNGKQVAVYNNDNGKLTVNDAAFFGTSGGTVVLNPVFNPIVFTVEYDANYPKEVTSPPQWENTNPKQYDIDDGAVSLDPPTAPEGYAFAGWKLEETDTTVTTLNSSLISEVVGTEISLVGSWSKQVYNLTVSIEGQPDVTHEAGANVPLSVYMGSQSKPTPPKGKVFKGWRINGELVTDLSKYLMPAESISVVAEFGDPEIVIPIDLLLPELDGKTYKTLSESVTVTPGEYTPATLIGKLTSATRDGFDRVSVTWEDGSTTSKQIDESADGTAFKVKATYQRKSFTVTINYYYDLDGDGVADDINGDGDPDKVATTTHEVIAYGASYNISSPAVEGLSAINTAISGVATQNVSKDVLYTTAPEKRTAAVAGIGGTVQNDKGGLLDTAVSATWDTSAASAHSAVAESTGREAYGVLGIDIVSAENAVFGVRGIYTITVNLGESMSEIGNYIVYKIGEDGSYAPVTVRMDGSTLQLTVDAAGDYLVVGAPLAQDNTLLWVIIALAALIVILIIVLLLILLLVRKKSITLVGATEGEEPTVIKAKKGDIIELPVPEEREGLVFAGWYLDEECTQPVPLEPEEDGDEDKPENPDGDKPETPDDTPDGDKPEGDGGAAADVTEAPAEEAPAEETAEAAPAEEAPAEEAADAALAEEAPAEETAEAAPAEEAAEAAPAEQTPAEETAEAAPAEQAPAEEEVRIYDQPGGNDVTDDQEGGGSGSAMSSKRAKKAKMRNNNAETPAQEIEVPASETVEEVPASETVEEVPASETIEEVPASETAEEVPASETAEEVPASETAEEVPASETIEEAPAQEAAAEETPAQEAAAEETPAQEAAAAEEVPAQETAEAETPAEEAPAEQAASESGEVPQGTAEDPEQASTVEEGSTYYVNPPEAEPVQEAPAPAATEIPVLPARMRYKVTGDVKLYARWVEKPPEEHIIGFIAGGYVAGVVHTMGREVLEFPAAHALDGYEFVGWFMTEEGREQPFTPEAYAEKYLYRDFIVYGQYDKLPEPEPVAVQPEPEPEPEPVVPHVISFIADGEVVATVETAGRDALDLPAAPVKEGFKFRGWFIDEETHENAVEESSFVDKDLTEDISVYAFYEEEKEEVEEEEVAAAVLPEEDEDEVEEVEEEEDDTPEVEEKEDDEEEPEDDGAPKLITAEDARKRRTSTMRGRLRYGSDVNKTIYEELVNHLLTYKNVSRSLTNRADNFKHKGALVAKITLTGKTIKLFLPLDPEQYEYDKYHQLITEKKGYEEVPFTLKVKSNRGLKYAKELIDETMVQKQVDKKKKTERKSFKELILLQKGSLLIKAKKTDKLRSRVDSQDANAQLTDAEALELIKVKNVPYVDEVKKTAFVGLDKIQDLYNDCDMVNIKTLRKRGLVKEEHNRVKIIGGGTLTKSLKVYADEYSLTAVKMIVLLGGKVVKLVEETLEPEGEEPKQ